jgi:hypothetical protein
MSNARLILAAGSTVLLAAIGASAFAYTAGVVVGPSNAGVTAIAAQVGASSRRQRDPGASGTAHSGASLTVVVASAPVVGAGGALLEATVTSLGEPVNGVPVTFDLRSPPMTLCTSTTDMEGVATCSVSSGQSALVSQQGYEATSSAGPGIPAGSSDWPTSVPERGTQGAPSVTPASSLSGTTRPPPPTTTAPTTTTTAPPTTTTAPPTTTTPPPLETKAGDGGS